MYGIGEEGCAFQLKSGFVRKYFINDDGRERYTIMVFNPVHVFVAIFHNFLTQRFVETVGVETENVTTVPGTMYGQIVYRTEHEVAFG